MLTEQQRVDPVLAAFFKTASPPEQSRRLTVPCEARVSRIIVSDAYDYAVAVLSLLSHFESLLLTFGESPTESSGSSSLSTFPGTSLGSTCYGESRSARSK